MKRSFWKSVVIMALLLVGTQSLAAQEAGPAAEASSFEVVVYVLGSGDGDRTTTAPKELTRAVSDIKSRTGKETRVLTWTMTHIGSGGSARIGTATEKIGGFQLEGRPIFTELSIGPLKPLADQPGLLEITRFESSWRVPLMIGGAPNYESMKYASNRILLRVGEPTLIGNLRLPSEGGDLFFVVLVKKAG